MESSRPTAPYEENDKKNVKDTLLTTKADIANAFASTDDSYVSFIEEKNAYNNEKTELANSEPKQGSKERKNAANLDFSNSSEKKVNKGKLSPLDEAIEKSNSDGENIAANSKQDNVKKNEETDDFRSAQTNYMNNKSSEEEVVTLTRSERGISNEKTANTADNNDKKNKDTKSAENSNEATTDNAVNKNTENDNEENRNAENDDKQNKNGKTSGNEKNTKYNGRSIVTAEAMASTERSTSDSVAREAIKPVTLTFGAKPRIPVFFFKK